ncbi:hypothetical protein V8C42DRAFT_32162 [Trichoderma barbatum]
MAHAPPSSSSCCSSGSAGDSRESWKETPRYPACQFPPKQASSCLRSPFFARSFCRPHLLPGASFPKGSQGSSSCVSPQPPRPSQRLRFYKHMYEVLCLGHRTLVGFQQPQAAATALWHRYTFPGGTLRVVAGTSVSGLLHKGYRCRLKYTHGSKGCV